MPKPTFFKLPEPKRARIVAAAIDEFASVAYAKATLDNIVEAAGISKGSMYQYFAGKADLYRWLLSDVMGARKGEAIAAHAPGPEASLWEVLESAFLAGLRFALAEPQLTRLGARFMRDAGEPELEQIAAANAAAGQAYIANLLEVSKAKGELRSDLDIAVTSRFIAHALGEGMLEQIAGRLGMSLQEYLATPDATQRLSEEEIVQLVRHVIGLLRDGAGAKGAEQ